MEEKEKDVERGKTEPTLKRKSKKLRGRKSPLEQGRALHKEETKTTSKGET